MANPLVSVIMSTYNERKEWLSGAIESIINQTYHNIEFIIVNDNPENKELGNILCEYQNNDKRIFIINNKENKGLITSLNTALSKCNGKYIARMDADDISLIDRIEKQVEFLENNNDIALIGTDISYINENNSALQKTSVLISDFELIKKRLNVYNSFNHPTWMFRKKILEDLGGYRNVKSAEDYDFITRLVLTGYKCSNINEKLLKYRLRANGISKSNNLLQRIATHTVAKYYRKKDLSDDIETELEKLVPNIERQNKFNLYLGEIEKSDTKRKYISTLVKFYLGNSDVRNEVNNRLYNKIVFKI